MDWGLGSPQGSDLSFFPQLLDIVLLATAVASTLVSLLIPCLYYLRRECRSHPTVLIANIALLESIANFNIVLMAVDIFAYEGDIRIDQLFRWLSFGIVAGDPAAEETDLCVYNYCVYMVVELLSISFHICYAVDLLLTVKLPFLPGRKRRNYYYLFSLALLAATLSNSLEEAEEICANELAVESIYKVPLWFLGALVAFCGVAVTIVAVSLWQGEGGQARIRRDYIRHHRVILLLLVVMWLPPIATNFLIRLDATDSTLFDVLNKTAFFCMIALTGVISIVRMASDRFLWQRVKAMLRCWGRRTNEEREDKIEEGEREREEEEVWNLPLSGAMNEFQSQQIVHCILQVVCEACSARLPLKTGSTRDSVRNSTLLYESVFRNTIVVEGEQEPEERSFLELFASNTDGVSPHAASPRQLRQLCRKKRKFHMVCQAPAHHENSPDRLAQKTVHIKSNLLATQTLRPEELNRLLSIRVTSYAHRVFEALREEDGLTTDLLTQALSVERNLDAIRKAKESLGASGSFFFFSHDHRLVIKTVGVEEKDRLMAVLPHYFSHVRVHPGSLLARTYGVFSLQIAGLAKIYFLMMENTFQHLQEAELHYNVYDLKGSTVQREVRDPHAPVKKDINYFRSNDCFLFLTPNTRHTLLQQLAADTEMLRSHNIMDYSLLLGVARPKESGRERGAREREGVEWRYVDELQEVTRRVYSISLIDYLQEFNFSKKMELWLKRVFKGGGDISSVDSDSYHRRFADFLARTLLPLSVKTEKGKPVFRIADSL